MRVVALEWKKMGFSVGPGEGMDSQSHRDLTVSWWSKKKNGWGRGGPSKVLQGKMEKKVILD